MNAGDGGKGPGEVLAACFRCVDNARGNLHNETVPQQNPQHQQQLHGEQGSGRCLEEFNYPDCAQAQHSVSCKTLQPPSTPHLSCGTGSSTPPSLIPSLPLSDGFSLCTANRVMSGLYLAAVLNGQAAAMLWQSSLEKDVHEMDLQATA